MATSSPAPRPRLRSSFARAGSASPRRLCSFSMPTRTSLSILLALAGFCAAGVGCRTRSQPKAQPPAGVGFELPGNAAVARGAVLTQPAGHEEAFLTLVASGALGLGDLLPGRNGHHRAALQLRNRRGRRRPTRTRRAGRHAARSLPGRARRRRRTVRAAAPDARDSSAIPARSLIAGRARGRRPHVVSPNVCASSSYERMRAAVSKACVAIITSSAPVRPTTSSMRARTCPGVPTMRRGS